MSTTAAATTTSTKAARADLNSIRLKRSQQLSPVLEAGSEIEYQYSYRSSPAIISKPSLRGAGEHKEPLSFNYVYVQSSLRDNSVSTCIVSSFGGRSRSTLFNTNANTNTKSDMQRQEQHHTDRKDIVDPYQVLQIRRDATNSEIRQSYRRLSLWHHPGRSVKATVEERLCRKHTFAILAACLETLLDTHARRRCDVLLRDMENMRKTNLQQYWPGVGEVRVGGRRLLGGHQLSSSSSTSSFDDRLSDLPPLSPASSCSSDADDDDGGDNEDDDEKKPLVQNDNLPTPERSTPVSSRKRQQQSKRKRNKPKTNLPPVHILTCCNASTDDDDLEYYFSPSSTTDSWSLYYNNKSTSRPRRRQQQVTSLLNSNTTSSSEASSDIHYTQVETTRLFGGPLQLLYRARRWKPFTDPFKVFAKIFGNNIALGDGNPCMALTISRFENNNNNNNITLEQQVHYRLPSPRHATAVSGTAERLPNGTTVFRKTRLLPDRSIIRTEVVRIDPRTGKKHATVTVTTQELPQSTMNDSTTLDCFLSRGICSFLSHWPTESKNQVHKLQQQQQQMDSANKELDSSDSNRSNVGNMWCFTTSFQSWLCVQ